VAGAGAALGASVVVAEVAVVASAEVLASRKARLRHPHRHRQEAVEANLREVARLPATESVPAKVARLKLRRLLRRHRSSFRRS